MERVVIVDDDRGMRLLARVTAEEAGCTVVGDAATAEEGLATIARLRPGIAIIDYAMPDLDGARATERVLEVSPATHVFAWTSVEDPAVIAALRAAGATEVFPKRELDGLRASLHRTAHGGAD